VVEKVTSLRLAVERMAAGQRLLLLLRERDALRSDRGH
jgi:hypothetical protein